MAEARGPMACPVGGSSMISEVIGATRKAGLIAARIANGNSATTMAIPKVNGEPWGTKAAITPP